MDTGWPVANVTSIASQLAVFRYAALMHIYNVSSCTVHDWWNAQMGRQIDNDVEVGDSRKAVFMQ